MTPAGYYVLAYFVVCGGFAFWLTYRLGYYKGKMDAFDQVSKHKIFDVLKNNQS